MRFTVNMTCDNAAFEDSPQHEVARILRRVADRLEFNIIEPTWHTIFDINGNEAAVHYAGAMLEIPYHRLPGRRDQLDRGVVIY